jgi:hypothetical protein
MLFTIYRSYSLHMVEKALRVALNTGSTVLKRAEEKLAD